MARLPSGDRSITEQWLIANRPATRSRQPGGENVFSQGIVVLTKIPGVELGLLHSGATLSIQAMNQLTNAQSSPLEYGPFANGASVNLSYPIQPAVSIGGTVELYPGTHASSAQVLLQQICSGVPTNFELTANASTAIGTSLRTPVASTRNRPPERIHTKEAR